MYDDDENEPVDELNATPATFDFPAQLFAEEDEEDNASYVRGYN